MSRIDPRQSALSSAASELPVSPPSLPSTPERAEEPPESRLTAAASPSAQALQRERQRVARRLGSGRTALPPGILDGLFASVPPEEATGPAASGEEDVRVRLGVGALVASIANTAETRENVSFLPPELSQRAAELTVRVHEAFFRHAGSTDQKSDADGMSIDPGTYPNLAALQTKWSKLADATLRLGGLYRAEMKSRGRAPSAFAISEATSQWQTLLAQTEQAVADFQPDDPTRLAQLKQRWHAARAVGEIARQQHAAATGGASELSATTSTATERPLSAARQRLRALDQACHEAAVRRLSDRHRICASPRIRTPQCLPR